MKNYGEKQDKDNIQSLSTMLVQNAIDALSKYLLQIKKRKLFQDRNEVRGTLSKICLFQLF
jgi:hypothetical protein